MQYKKADKKILYIWWLKLFVIILCVCAITSLALKLFSNMWNILMFTFLMIFILLFSFYFPIKYKRFSYAITKTHVVLFSGVIYQKVTYLELDNIQFVRLSRSIVNRMFKLSSVKIYTAGGIDVIFGLDIDEAEKICALLANINYDSFG